MLETNIVRSRAQNPQLNQDEIIAEFQRRRRRYVMFCRWTIGIGVGGFFIALIVLHFLPRLNDAPYWLFGGMVAAMLVLVFGALCAPTLYRCPNCSRIVQVPDPTEAGKIPVRDPVECPNCGVRLKATQDDGNRTFSFGVTFRRRS